ncbi:hypothetical protein CMEL01_16728 [Colletotrichum melonis]|uniref:Uncharacterized protein n=1 Tax=Colletotrichum melonis TaxID=1209925 RepID=A0AAI9U9T7_9PEZI|nr:hypothetical protein CMEL01_16728 [Colletotrichum melonis]
MRASINQEGSSGSVAVLLYPPQDLVDEVTKRNHASSHFDLLDTLYLQMNKRGSRHFVAVLPRLVLFALSSELRGDKSVTYMWEDASQVFMWASHPSKESSICQLPSERPEVLIRGVPDLEDWLRRGRSPPHIEKMLILTTEDAIRSCQAWKKAPIESMEPALPDIGRAFKVNHHEDTAAAPIRRRRRRSGAYLDGEI